MSTSNRFDAISKASVTASLREMLVTGLWLTSFAQLLTLTRLQQQSSRLGSVTSEKSCYAIGGYVVEVESRPIRDWCCVCEDAKGAICTDAAPKAVFNATDSIGRFQARSVACLLAGDKPAPGCTATCMEIPVRASFSGYGG